MGFNVIEPYCTGQFTEEGHNIILVGGTGTGNTHTAIALGRELIQNKKKVRFFNAIDLINLLIQEQLDTKQGRLNRRLQSVDCVIVDELGYIPFPKSGGALLFHLMSKIYERTSIIITTNLDFGEWVNIHQNIVHLVIQRVLKWIAASACSFSSS